MRIESFVQVQQMYQMPKTTKTSGTNSTSFSDKLQISSMGKDIQLAKQAVNNTADVREDVIAPLRERIQNGTYNVSSESFADRIMEKFMQVS